MHRRVVVSGFVFASIVHEASKYKNDSEGLLCGNVTHLTKDQITDSQSSASQKEIEYALFDIIPYERLFSFYDHLGRIMINSKEKSDPKLFLGWYKIRRNTQSRISMREKAVIKNFIEKFDLTTGLVFILCTPQSHQNQSTINFTYKCFICNRDKKCADGLKIDIINLGHTGTHPEYRNRSCLIEPIPQSEMETGNTMTSSTAIPLICDSYEASFLRENGAVSEVHHIQRMYKDTMKIMKQFQEDLSRTENEIGRYEEEILQLRKAISKENEDDTDIDSGLVSGANNRLDRVDENEAKEESPARVDISQLTLKEESSVDGENQPEKR